MKEQRAMITFKMFDIYPLKMKVSNGIVEMSLVYILQILKKM